MARILNRHSITVAAMRLVQPGRLADITEGVKRLLPSTPEYGALKAGVKSELELLRSAGLVALVEGQRYVLTERGEAVASETGIGYLIDARRMYLLKETRKGMDRSRSSTRNRSLVQ